MKYLVITLLLFPILLHAQQDTTSTDSLTNWEKSGNLQVNFSNVALKNWSGGGEAALSLSTDVNYQIDYDGEHLLWDNQFDLIYGIVRQGEVDEFRKTDDQLIIRSLVGYQLSKQSNFSFLTELRTQIGAGQQIFSLIIAIAFR